MWQLFIDNIHNISPQPVAEKLHSMFMAPPLFKIWEYVYVIPVVFMPKTPIKLTGLSKDGILYLYEDIELSHFCISLKR